MTNLGLILAYILIVVAALACMVSPFLRIKNDFKKIKKIMLPIVVLIVIVGISILNGSGSKIVVPRTILHGKK